MVRTPHANRKTKALQDRKLAAVVLRVAAPLVDPHALALGGGFEKQQRQYGGAEPQQQKQRQYGGAGPQTQQQQWQYGGARPQQQQQQQQQRHYGGVGPQNHQRRSESTNAPGRSSNSSSSSMEAVHNSGRMA